ncbi:hypothetical protein [Maridesulfovibrio salexigens]|uniref:hypothetical protein n=1 Tax=Maridesulfovibrio salexigens TaxID=880 RepID=UPI0003155C19|nr:hypothetical protein [Maridesulfovibrio salexigens]
MSKKQIAKAIGQHWDEHRAQATPQRNRWWKSPRIVGHINKMICGKYLTGVSEGPIELIKEFLNGKSFNEALSIGCGGAHKGIGIRKTGLS